MAELDDDLILRRRRSCEHGQGNRGYSKYSQHVTLRDVILATPIIGFGACTAGDYSSNAPRLPLVCRKIFSVGKAFAQKQERQALVPLRTKPS
jgi:hypothetical protein